VAAVEARIQALTDYLHGALDADGFEVVSPRDRTQRAGITIVRMPDAARTVAQLAEAGIVVAARGAGLRVSVHVFNSEADIDHLLAGLKALRRGEAAPPRPRGLGPRKGNRSSG
jgi:selenocysteine lyase/cysteine desulfurase